MVMRRGGQQAAHWHFQVDSPFVITSTSTSCPPPLSIATLPSCSSPPHISPDDYHYSVIHLCLQPPSQPLSAVVHSHTFHPSPPLNVLLHSGAFHCSNHCPSQGLRRVAVRSSSRGLAWARRLHRVSRPDSSRPLHLPSCRQPLRCSTLRRHGRAV